MIATIFALRGQDGIVESIIENLRIFVHPALQFESIVLDDNNYEREGGASYVRLLRAAAIASSDFGVQIETSSTGWSYMGTGATAKDFLRLARRNRIDAFPAVAVLDRMVMLPEGIHQALDGTSGFSFLIKPVDLGGVLLVDFADQSSIEKSARALRRILVTDLEKVAVRQVYARRIVKPDAVDLADLFRQSQRDPVFLALFEEIHPQEIQFIPRVVSSPARLDVPSPVVIELRRTGQDQIEEIRVQVRAPTGVLPQTVVAYLDVKNPDVRWQTIEFSVRSRTTPYCPLALTVSAEESELPHGGFPLPVLVPVLR